eukprot:CAMPEP_0119013840 /NCGR_PEP_ID=MMETSP1176-20130426/9074_1 /TAXON_ID=265551 /ORGANISM="Synedropsis recta cf, Strain CCMP1620" /LENGTH=202 /DNA_ID=CAMNT_0006966961 /DNA_START=136 /DNA_END=744 /DNA_ORIENTATION=+
MFFSKTTTVAFLLLTAVKAQYSTLTADPKCAKFEAIEVFGIFDLIEVGNSTLNLPGPDQGDVIIAASLVPTASLPITQTFFKVLGMEVQSICTVVTNGSNAPSCHIEVDLNFCIRRCTIDETGKIEQKDDQVLDVQTLVDPIPYDCSRVFKGSFTATGTGPEAYAITGGTGDLFGAFGEWDGVFSTTTIDTTMNLCFYPDYV